MSGLSICIPTFERPALLERALKSVMDGTESRARDFDLVVCDDSADDRSARLCERVFGAWPGSARHVENRPGLGMVENFNRCVALATGRYILILHDDDYLLPGGLPALVDATLSRPDQHPVLLFGVDVVDAMGRLRRRQSFSSESDLSPEKALTRALSNSSYVRFPGMVVSADAYRAVGPFDATLGGSTDLDMWIRLFARYGVRCMPQTTSAYSVHGQAHSVGMSTPDTIATLERIFDRVIERRLLPDDTVRGLKADFLAQFILGGAYRHLRIGDRREARRIMRLFELPGVRSAGRSRRWWLVRTGISLLMRLPGPLAAEAQWLERMYPDTSILWPH